MEDILNYLRRNKIVILLSVLLIGLGSGYLLLNRPNAKPKSNFKTEQVATKAPKDKPNKPAQTSELLAIDIQGAVKKAGVYRVKKGTIVQEALNLAGGLNANADIKQINQAQRVSDQMQLYVPVKGEMPTAATSTGKATPSSTKTGGGQKVVNLNTATADDFKNVKGVGPKKAERIVKYREEHGPFKQVHDLTGVSGIGEKSLAKIKDQLTV